MPSFIQNNKNALVIMLVVVVIFCFAILFKNYLDTKRLVSNLQFQLEQEHSESKELQLQLEELNRTLIDTRAKLSELTQRLGTLEDSNAELAREKQRLEAKVKKLEDEKILIEARLQSLGELKKAIREVKIGIREQKRRRYLASKQRQQEIDAKELAAGNRGYLLRDGRSCYKTVVKIDVQFAE